MMYGKEEKSVYEKSKVSSSTFHIVTESPVAMAFEMLILFLYFNTATDMHQEKLWKTMKNKWNLRTKVYVVKCQTATAAMAVCIKICL